MKNQLEVLQHKTKHQTLHVSFHSYFLEEIPGQISVTPTPRDSVLFGLNLPYGHNNIKFKKNEGISHGLKLAIRESNFILIMHTLFFVHFLMCGYFSSFQFPVTSGCAIHRNMIYTHIGVVALI